MNGERVTQRQAISLTRPHLMEMKNIAYPKPWEEEWYTTWFTRKTNAGRESKDKRYKPMMDDGMTRAGSVAFSRMSVFDNVETQESLDTSKTIGKIHAVRYRAGERMSRVHYEYSSFLFKSKWKRKYFPKGIFSNT